MGSKTVCELLVSWEIMENRSVSEVTKVVVNGEVISNGELLKCASAGTHNGGHHSEDAHVVQKDAANGNSVIECSTSMRHESETKTGPIHLHPFMHPELIDSACCELRILCSPRSNLRVTSIEVQSNAKHLELYDSLGEYIQTTKGELSADRESYTARCSLDRNVFEVVVKFLSLLDAKCLIISSLDVTLEHFEWPKESIAAAAPSAKAHSANAAMHPHSHAHPHAHLAGPAANLPMSPAMLAAGLQRVLASAAAGTGAAQPASTRPVPAPSNASDRSHAQLGPRLRLLADVHFAATAAAPKTHSTEIPRCASDDVTDQADTKNGELRRFSEPPGANSAAAAPHAPPGQHDTTHHDEQHQLAHANTAPAPAPAPAPAARANDQAALLVYQTAAALYGDLTDLVEQRFAQLELRLTRHLDERLALAARTFSPAADATGAER